MKLTSGLVGAEAKGPIGWLIWDNPSKLNALSPGMYAACQESCRAFGHFGVWTSGTATVTGAGKLLIVPSGRRISGI